MNGPDPKPQRLFLALWPDGIQRKRLVDIQKTVLGVSGRAVVPANLHVTVAFLGNVTAVRQQEVERIAAEWIVPKVDLAFARIAFWPKARLICLEAPEPSAAFLDAVAQLHACLREVSFVIESRPFRAHVTLIRHAAQQPAPAELPVLPSPLLWPVRTLSLVASTSAPGGSVYTVLSTWPSAQTHVGSR